MSERHDGEPRRVVLITGASRGLGRATAERLETNGWQVFATARDAPSDPTRRSPNGSDQRGGELIRLRADVRDAGSVRTALSALLALTRGRLDAVVANAGIAAVGTFEDTPTDVMVELMETNYFGVLNTIRETLPALRASKGRIVVMSSDSGVYGTPGLSGYSASKFAVEGWAESIAYELRPYGIRVSIIRPGAFRSTIWQSRIYTPSEGPTRELAETLAANWRAAADQAGDPARVAAAIEQALRSRNPRLHYTVGNDARRAVALRRALPDRLFARFVERSNHLPSAHSLEPGAGR
jgi:NAD(P)-dependent dehydrogenase (short-subunit alcohol dehydrogenase family)